ncbi:hypothetical protein FACS189442_0430 [Spirochaetia bacterium]|nr:hypothetical protein FACS189442_0430 [Spirochaetia bacterium]
MTDAIGIVKRTARKHGKTRKSVVEVNVNEGGYMIERKYLLDKEWVKENEENPYHFYYR